jgi:hypothetical protein
LRLRGFALQRVALRDLPLAALRVFVQRFAFGLAARAGCSARGYPPPIMAA